MYKEKRFLCVIPARKGSKRIKWKNILPLAGRPLLEYTIECAKKSLYIDRVIVSTDSYFIKKLAQQNGVDVPFIRPKILATDEAKTIDVLLHTIEYCKNIENQTYDYVVLLQNTSPLRKTWQVDEAIEKIVNNLSDSLVSISALKIRAELMRKFYDDKNITPIFNKEEIGNLIYRVNGAIYINRINKNLNKNTILANNNLAYIMDKKTSVDIDTIEDIEMAEYYLETKKG
jgi:acylneuraminate cytidylyltransferase